MLVFNFFFQVKKEAAEEVTEDGALDLQKEKLDEEKLSEKESVEENGTTVVKSEQIVPTDGTTTEQKVADSLELSENEKKEEKEPEMSAADKKEVCVTNVFIISQFISCVLIKFNRKKIKLLKPPLKHSKLTMKQRKNC